MENTTKKRGTKHAVTNQNREAVRAAVKSISLAFPDWSMARIAKTLGIGETTVREILKPSNRSHKKKLGTSYQQVIFDEFDCEPVEDTDEPAQIVAPSREYGTSSLTASILAEREALGNMRIAAVRLKHSAEKLEDSIEQMDALLKGAYVKGTQVGQELGCMLEVK